MGPSYMEDDTRALTDQYGFCEKHIRDIYNQNNRLGMAWVMKTHFEKVIKEAEKNLPKTSAKLLKKDIASTPLLRYVDTLNESCFVCNRINAFMARYVDTVFYLYKSDEEFREKFRNCKGFCTPHYSLLLKTAPKHLGGTMLEEFVDLVNDLYLTNMKRVKDDLAWFINKFDYRYQDEPWYNAKDSLQRAMIKDNGVIIDPNGTNKPPA